MEARKAMRLFRRLWLRCIKNVSKGATPEEKARWMQEAKAAKDKWAQARREYLEH